MIWIFLSVVLLLVTIEWGLPKVFRFLGWSALTVIGIAILMGLPP